VDRLKQMAISDFQMLSGMARGLPRNLPLLFQQLQTGQLAFGVADKTLAEQESRADARTLRMVRTAFSITCLVSGTCLVGVDGLASPGWGVPWLSFMFWGIALPGMLTLVRRAGLV